MRDGCAARSRASGEALHGTASRARRWVLLEHPGAWGADVLADATLPPHVGAHLRRLAHELPARVLLLRRAPGVPREVPHRRLLAGVTGPDGGWFESFDLTGPDEVRDVDLAGLSRGASVGGAPVTAPFYLVCTNGKHDACCAEFGRPVVDALAPRLGDRLWECSHVGGDRFAGNLVCLPHGTMYGHLDAGSAGGVVAAHEAGRIALEHWRGRTAHGFPLQSAEAFARRELDLDRLDDLRLVGARSADATTTATFRVTGSGREVVVVVRRTAGPEPRKLTCAGAPVPPPVHELVSLERR